MIVKSSSIFLPCCALAGAAALATLFAAIACNAPPGTCSVTEADASITINVEYASEQNTTVATQGACTAASCIAPFADSGCAVWQATQTGTQGDICNVGFVIPDGGFLFEKAVANQTACGFYEPQIVHF